ncbi:MAG TPA: hypothetical protein VIW28_14265 [Gemmatimonadales bacterium]
MLARDARLEEPLRLRRREHDVEGLPVRGLPHGEAALGEHLQHLDVFGEDLGLKLLNAVGSGDQGQVLEQQRPDAPALVFVGDRHRELGA